MENQPLTGLERQTAGESYPFITDALFIAADVAAVTLFRQLYTGEHAEGLLVLQSVVFCLYAWLILSLHRTRTFQVAHQVLNYKIPNLLFWLKLCHVFAFIYIPFGLFIYFVSEAGNYTGDGDFILIVFLLLPAAPLLIGRSMGTDSNPETAKHSHPLTMLRWFALNMGFIAVFAFTDIAFKNLGDWLCLELTRELTGIYHAETEPLMFLKIIYSALFIWLVYIPVRMWLLIPFYRNRLKVAGFVFSLLIIFLNSVFPELITF